MKTELQAYVALRGRTSVSLAKFLHDQALELEDVYRAAMGPGRSGWTNLKRQAGLLVAEPGPEEEYFSRRFADLLHVDDPLRLAAMEAAARGVPDVTGNAGPTRLALQMLAYQVDGRQDQTGTAEAFVERLHLQSGLADELRELAALLQTRTTLSALPVPGLEDTPLVLHAGYSIREVLTAVGWLTAKRRTPFQAGVLALPARKSELLFVTLDKSEGYHDRIAYHDYAISTERFHWQTQTRAPSTSRASATS